MSSRSLKIKNRSCRSISTHRSTWNSRVDWLAKFQLDIFNFSLDKAFVMKIYDSDCSHGGFHLT